MNQVPPQSLQPTIALRFAPSKVIISTLMLLFVFAVITVFYATQLPSVTGQFSVEEQQLTYSDQGNRHIVTAISGIPDEWLPLSAVDLIEEPDYLNYYQRYNAFFEKQSALFHHLSQSHVLLKTEGGATLKVNTGYRHWYELPFNFWAQLIPVAVALIIGAWLWSFRQNDPAATQYYISAIFIAVTIFPAAIYSSRPLAVSGEVFHFLSVMDHLGLYIFCAAMLSLNWLFPYPISALKVPRYLYIGFASLWVLNTLQWLPNFDVSIRLVSCATLIGVISMVLIHWWRSRTQPQFLILIKWFALSTIFGPSIFVVLIFLPPIFEIEPLISQSFAFGAFASIYLIMAIAVSRYKLFEYERWWSESLIWFAFGLLVIGLDVLFIVLLDISYQQASWLALALTGWVYFPIRQRLLHKLVLSNEQKLQTLLPDIVSVIAGSANHSQLSSGMQDCLVKLYDPLYINSLPQRLDKVNVSSDGSQLMIPLPDKDRRLELLYADRGKRLFNSHDQKTANALVNLFNNAVTASKAKEEGIQLERKRIRQDMHDTLGGYLLSIMHKKQDPQSALLARYAWNELRDILSALDDNMSPLSMNLLRWKGALEKLFTGDDLAFNFNLHSSAIEVESQLGGLQRLNLGQVLREAVTNAFRHAAPTFINVDIQYDSGNLLIRIENDGQVAPPDSWKPGRGLTHIRSRVAQLQGVINWQMSSVGHLVMTLSVPIVLKHTTQQGRV